MSRKISDSTVRRLSLYLSILEGLPTASGHTVSSEELAAQAGTTAAQVRKDLSLFGSFGKRGLGYSILELAAELRDILGLGRRWRVALIGAGRLGSALFGYAGFADRGFDIVAVLDVDPEKIGKHWGRVPIQDATQLKEHLDADPVDIAIVAVPGDSAQHVVDVLAEAGVVGILNFAPTKVRVGEDATHRGVNLVTELEALSFALSRPDPEG